MLTAPLPPVAALSVVRLVSLDNLTHSAINDPDDDPLRHALVREEKGLRPGGLGLAITRSIVDELIYNEKRNEVVFVKYLDWRGTA